jgi:hypothetical protein
MANKLLKILTINFHELRRQLAAENNANRHYQTAENQAALQLTITETKGNQEFSLELLDKALNPNKMPWKKGDFRSNPKKIPTSQPQETSPPSQ